MIVEPMLPVPQLRRHSIGHQSTQISMELGQLTGHHSQAPSAGLMDYGSEVGMDDYGHSYYVTPTPQHCNMEG